MTVFTLLTIINNQISVFYIIYLFWFDEFLRTIFQFIFYYFKRKEIKGHPLYFKTIKSKLFVLFIYFIFIIVCFGLLIDWKNTDLILINFEVFLFKNELFNFTIVTFLGRELLLYFKNELNIIHQNIFLSKRIIILHISIIIGMCIWAFLPKYIYENSSSNILSAIIISPFLLLKLFFEIQEIKHEITAKKL
jgi:hypothetical protein